MSLQERAEKLKTQTPAVFLAIKDKRTPWYAKVTAAVTVVYALSPIDLVPDFIPVLGYLDDMIILPALITLTAKSIPEIVWEDCLIKAEKMWIDGKPKKWYYAIPIILFWLLIAWLIIKCFW